MKLRSVICCIGACLLLSSAAAQSDTVRASNVTYYNQFLVGGGFGKKAEIVTLSSVMFHGVRYKRTSIGIGIAYDTYQEWKTFPFMTSLSYEMPVKRNAWFVQLDGGYGRVRHIDSEFDTFIYNGKGGRVLHPSIGYKLAAGKYSIYLKAGYKFQTIFYDQNPKWWPESYTNHVKRDMNRVTLQLGFGLH